MYLIVSARNIELWIRFQCGGNPDNQLLRIVAGIKKCEFIPSDPNKMLVVRKMNQEIRHQAAQYQITIVVPLAVVQLFEIVDIDQGKIKAPPLVSILGSYVIELLLQKASVPGTGQGVFQREKFHAVTRLLQFIT